MLNRTLSQVTAHPLTVAVSRCWTRCPRDGERVDVGFCVGHLPVQYADRSRAVCCLDGGGQFYGGGARKHQARHVGRVLADELDQRRGEVRWVVG